MGGIWRVLYVLAIYPIVFPQVYSDIHNFSEYYFVFSLFLCTFAMHCVERPLQIDIVGRIRYGI